LGEAGSNLTAISPQLELMLQQGSAPPCANEVHHGQQQGTGSVFH